MKLIINNKYLIFPVNTHSTKKSLVFKINEKVVYKLNIKLDNTAPNFYAYIDVSRFVGQEIEFSVSPLVKLVFNACDEINIDNLYNEPMRPQIHFTPKNGWINDPNGLIYWDGLYHMFYQYNPTEPDWENMHWGHAESKDLIHWEEKDIALFPDERGMMFSGSAILDNKNLLGENIGNKTAAVLFYTTTTPFCQQMAYSVDNFKTIVQYNNNPVIDGIGNEDRDPKVVFCDELDCYIMILYLADDIYCILKSDNLKDWSELQNIQLKGDNECPDVFPINDQNGNRKWVIMGAHDKYLIGSFESGMFVAEQSVLSLHYGTAAYAGQTFSNLPNGRVVRVVWDRWKSPVLNFKGQMGIPMEMTLCNCNGVSYLEANPVKEIESVYKISKIYNNVFVAFEHMFSEILEPVPHLFKLKGKFFEICNFSIKVFGTVINFDFSKNEITVGNCTAPISYTRQEFDVTVIIDTCSMELFSDGGKVFMSFLDNNTQNYLNAPCLEISADREITLDSVEIHSLNSIWKSKSIKNLHP